MLQGNKDIPLPGRAGDKAFKDKHKAVLLDIPRRPDNRYVNRYVKLRCTPPEARASKKQAN